MPHDYDPSKTEEKWQRKWEEEGAYAVDLKKAKNPYYNLVMFPYPSGDKLHVGHWYNFAPADSWGRYMRMRGHDVFEPMGFDAFGLPAENYAIKTGTPPAESTRKNVETMIKQLKRIGCMYDWAAMVNTSEPWYYRWTQWLFLQMYAHGLAYKKLAPVNFCPKDQTVLANEQVWDGKCERCGTEVVQKNLTQWFWKITDYSQRLLDGLEDLDWPEKTKAMQRHWIGRKEGIEIMYKLKDSSKTVTVFTTRPETNFGATFVVVSPEHPDVDAFTLPSHKKSVAAYLREAKKKTTSERANIDRRKTGVFTGSYAVNDLTGYEMPIYVADYVLMDFGTGMVVGVPGHDMRDFEFAIAMGNIEIKRVIKSANGDTGLIDSPEKVFEDEGEIIHSEFLNGLHPHAAIPKMMDHMEKTGMGKRVTTYRLHDWLVSRQRYWGAPIPIVYDPEGKAHPIPEKHLPWILPTDVEFKPTGESPLKHSKELKERTEKLFGKGWTPEYDTMDTFVCSSFYYLMYMNAPEHRSRLLATAHEGGIDLKKKKGAKHDIADPLVDPTREKMWMPVSMYIGGPEHACMHLIYARFVMKALKDFGFTTHDEPFKRLLHQGLITNKGAKMSKSKGNVVSPDSFIDRHGSDVFRMYLMFMGPFTDGGDWSDTGIKGIDRFVQRLWNLMTTKVSTKIVQEEHDVLPVLHKTIKNVTESMDSLRFNTAISSLMELLNVLEKKAAISRETATIVVRLLAPLAPHLSEELWEGLNANATPKKSSAKKTMKASKKPHAFVVQESWPSFDPKLLIEKTITIAVQVNGKLRGDIQVDADTQEKEILAAAKSHANVAKYLEGRTPKKEIYVKGKLVSLVL